MTKREAKKLFNKNVIDLDMFDSQVRVFFNREDFNRAITYRGHNPVVGGNGWALHSILENIEEKEEDHQLLMGVFDNTLRTMVHEATHIAIFFCDMIGHPITKYDEIVPYLTSHIVTKAIELRDKQ